MQAALVTSVAMLVISLILSLAMAIAWVCFGRPKHALAWSVAYLLYGLEIVVVAIDTMQPSIHAIAQPIALAMVLTPAALVAIGARLRAGKPSLGRLIALAGGIVFVVDETVRLLPFPVRWVSTFGGLFTAAMLAIAIAAIWPRQRKKEPAELVIVAALAVFILFELLLVAADLYAKALPGDPHRIALFNTIYLSGLTPVFVASGIGAILLLASDLAVELRALAVDDPLTSVLNRRGFHEAAIRAIAASNRNRQAVTIVLTDIDRFKSINDRFGHAAGDRTLHFVAQRIAQGIRQEDLVGRVGGEEFAVLLVNSTAEQAVEVIERIRQVIAAGFSDAGAPLEVTASFGVATVAAGVPETMLLEAMDRADRALYRSKVEGRNRITLDV